MGKTNNPLVSIVIVTYNSAAFVIETLESMKQQTYQNIEVIVSDDCSKDDTVNICKKWFKENNERFVSTKLITTSKNTGISQNFNRGLAAAKGEWIKTIAGDDALLPNIIEEYIQITYSQNDIEFLHCNVAFYNDNFEEENKFEISNGENYKINLNTLTASEQHEILLRKNLVLAPTVFFKRSLLEKFGGFNEDYPLIEDQPMWVKFTSAGVKLQFLNTVGVKYRITSTSVLRNSTNDKLFNNFLVQKSKYIYANCIPLYRGYEKLIKGLYYKRILILDKYNLNKRQPLIVFLVKLTSWPLLRAINKIDKKYQ